MTFVTFPHASLEFLHPFPKRGLSRGAPAAGDPFGVVMRNETPGVSGGERGAGRDGWQAAALAAVLARRSARIEGRNASGPLTLPAGKLPAN